MEILTCKQDLTEEASEIKTAILLLVSFKSGKARHTKEYVGWHMYYECYTADIFYYSILW
jgi:hypothetical protein